MKSLLHAPQLENAFVDDTVEYDGETYEFSIRTVSYAETADLFTTPEGMHQGSMLLSKLIVFRDDEGNVTGLTYDAAKRLPPKLAAQILPKALEANGFGENNAKN